MAITDRMVQYGLVRRSGGAGLDVFLEVAPLQARQLERVPEWTRATHERLFSAHLEGFDGVAEHQAKVTAAVDLDRFRDRIHPVPDRTPPTGASGARAMSFTRRNGSPGTPVGPVPFIGAEQQIRRAHICRFPSGKPAASPVGGLR
ncbi:MAG: hypothetical protein R2696_12580 [Microthrixaceae bacterium]